jgi:hypothetical protein
MRGIGLKAFAGAESTLHRLENIMALNSDFITKTGRVWPALSGCGRFSSYYVFGLFQLFFSFNAFSSKQRFEKTS